MLNNNHNSCQFAEQTVSYLYGEAAASEKAEYELHLKTCPTCADELAGFGFIRSSVLDWRNEDFAKLQTPAFDIPATKSKNVFSPASNPSESRSWFGGLGKIFNFNPATAAFADGRVVELRAGELFYIPPEPHDSWVVGDVPYVSLHFLGADHYAR